MPKKQENGEASTTLPERVEEAGGQLALVPSTRAEDLFAAYSSERDELLEYPFTNNTVMAKDGITFTIVRSLGVRFSQDIDDPARIVEQFAYVIRLQTGYMTEDKNTGEVTEYEDGCEMLLCLSKNGIRQADADRIRDITETVGPIPNCALQLYPNKDRLKNPSVGIVNAAKWRTLRQVVEARSR